MTLFCPKWSALLLVLAAAEVFSGSPDSRPELGVGHQYLYGLSGATQFSVTLKSHATPGLLAPSHVLPVLKGHFKELGKTPPPIVVKDMIVHPIQMAQALEKGAAGTVLIACVVRDRRGR